MSTLDTAKLYTRLSGDGTLAALVSTRIYPVVLPQNPTLPAVTYHRVSTDEVAAIDDAYIDLENARIQVDCWDDDHDGAIAVADAVRGAMTGSTANFAATCINNLIIPGDTQDLFRVSLEFSVWNSEA